jgi:hypothetical protein
MADEYGYIEGKVKAGKVEKARRLEHFHRYRDDCTIYNFDN